MQHVNVLCPPPSTDLRTRFLLNLPLLKMCTRSSPVRFREAGPSISRIYELVWCIIDYCDWDTIAQLSNCNRYLRSLTQQLMFKKLRRFMLPYVPDDSLKRFFRLLSETRAVLTGGLIHAMLLSFADPIYHTVKPFQLEMVVPDNGDRGMEHWKRFFHAVGFTKVREMKTEEPYAPWSRRTMLLTKESPLVKLRICVMGSNSDDVAPIILSSPHTSGMNILTSRKIYCLYPSLLRRGENMVVSRSNFVGNLSDPTFQPFNFGLRTYIYGRGWGYGGRACGENCPALWRDIKSMKYARIMHLGSLEGDLDNGMDMSPSDGLQSSSVIWRMNGACSNIFCRNYMEGRMAE